MFINWQNLFNTEIAITKEENQEQNEHDKL